METVKGLCPKCGKPVTLTEYGRYLSKELSGFEPIFEGWCPNCVERLVEHGTLSGPQECKANGAQFKIAK